VGGDLGGDGKWVDASRRNWKAPDNKLLEILFMFTGNFVHVDWKYRTFRQADSGPTRGGKTPAGPIKNNFFGGGLLRSVGGDLGVWVDASRRNWKAPDNKLLESLFMFTGNFVHVHWKLFYWKVCSCLLEILFMFTGKKNIFVV
jgi:hypothetical protein